MCIYPIVGKQEAEAAERLYNYHLAGNHIEALLMYLILCGEDEQYVPYTLKFLGQ